MILPPSPHLEPNNSQLGPHLTYFTPAACLPSNSQNPRTNFWGQDQLEVQMIKLQVPLPPLLILIAHGETVTISESYFTPLSVTCTDLHCDVFGVVGRDFDSGFDSAGCARTVLRQRRPHQSQRLHEKQRSTNQPCQPLPATPQRQEKCKEQSSKIAKFSCKRNIACESPIEASY